MDNIKYTSDGKKVLVVGKLNAEQTIVQEIFVSAGQEIPSGENFVVKSLHDQPAESWKEKNLRDLESRYETQKAKLEREMDEHARRLRMAIDKAKAKTDCLLRFAANSDDSQLDTLKKFMSGEITHLFVGGYSPQIVDFNDSNEPFDVDSWGGRVKVEGMKLVSLLGRSDGSLSYRLSHYSDGSGGGKDVKPAAGYEEALAMAQAEFEEQCAAYLEAKRSSIDLASWQKIKGIVVPDDVMAKYQEEADANRKARIKQLRDELAKLEA